MNIINKEGEIIEYFYQDIYIKYIVTGDKYPIIFLHGWGQNKETFNNLAKKLKEYKIYQIDLIGFGESHEPTRPYSLDDYVSFLEKFIKDLNIKNPIIIGHSFGGRIAIKYASKNKNLKAIILINSAGIKRIKLSKCIKIIKYKITKHYLLKTRNYIKYNKLVTSTGSSDYLYASPIMKITLSKIVKENLKRQLKKIQVNSLIIWGKQDQETPYKDALLMKKLIKKSNLITFNAGHFTYMEKENDVSETIKKFIESETK